jgi:hypothetical protein
VKRAEGGLATHQPSSRGIGHERHDAPACRAASPAFGPWSAPAPSAGRASEANRAEI